MHSQDNRQSGLLSQFFESTLVSVAMFDRDMQYIKANRRYLTDYRLNADNIIGRSFYDDFPVLPQGWQEAHKRCLAGATQRVEDCIVHSDGATIRAHWELQPWHGPEGQVDGILLFSEIISASPHPVTCEEQSFSFFRNNPQPMWIYDLETLRFLDVNNAAIHHYGYTYDEFMQMTIKDIRPSDDVAALMKNIEKVSNGLDIAGCWRHLKKDGTLILVEIISHTLTFNNRSAELVMAHDITQRKTVEGELVAQKDLLEKILTNIPVMICTIDPNGQVTFANKEFLRVLDMSLEEIQSHPDIFSVWYPDPEYRAYVMEFIQKAEGKFVEFSTHGSSGKIIPTSFANILLQDGTSVGIGQDITERKQAEKEREALIEQLQKKTAEQERFIYTISHDLKTPLVTIGGYCGVVKEDLASGDKEQCKKDLDIISNAANFMEQLLNELLHFSRVGIQMNPRESVSLADLINEAIESISGVINAHQTTIEVESELPNVMVDRLNFIQVFKNLLANASRYSRSANGGSIVKIGVTRSSGELICYVQDNGIGIMSQYLEKIFGLFEKLDAEDEGTGVGLAIVKRIVETHGGRIWAESEGLGHGTTFFLTLPEA